MALKEELKKSFSNRRMSFRSIGMTNLKISRKRTTAKIEVEEEAKVCTEYIKLKRKLNLKDFN